MRASKKELRKTLGNMPGTGDDAVICERILAHPWFQAANTVMAYCHIPPEPDLTAVLTACLRQGKTLLLPRCGENGEMTAHRMTDFGQLVSGTYGILEPGPDLEVFPPERIELILTPGLAFSPQGARLGRGKGYYDRFLPRTGARTIGICYRSRILRSIPTEIWDRCVDAVISDGE